MSSEEVKSRRDSPKRTSTQLESSTPPSSGDEYFANLFLLFFGSGTFALPWGFARAGVIGGAAGVVIVGFLTWLTISMLVKSKRLQQRRLLLPSLARRNSSRGKFFFDSQRSQSGFAAEDEASHSEALQKSLTYAAIASHAFGTPFAGRIVKTATTFSCLGACGGFITFVSGLLLPLVREAADAYLRHHEELSSSEDTPSSSSSSSSGLGGSQLSHFFSSLSVLSPSAVLHPLAVDASELDQASLVWGVLLPVLVPLTWVRSFKGLAQATAFGNVVFVASVVLVLGDGWARFGPPQWPQDFDAAQGGALRLFPDSAASFSLFINPCIYLFTVHYCALPIEAEGSSLISTALSDPATSAAATGTPISSPLMTSPPSSSSSSASPRVPTSATALLVSPLEFEHGQATTSTSTNTRRGCGRWAQWSRSFEGALVLAISASVVLNVLFGSLAYVTFGTATIPPLLAGAGGERGGSGEGEGEEGWSRADEVEGCDAQPPYMCDDVVKNVEAGPLKVVTSIALVLNLALTYVLMLAPSRQYIEAAALDTCAKLWPALFTPRRPQPPSSSSSSPPSPSPPADEGEATGEGGEGAAATGGEEGGGGEGKVEDEEDDEDEEEEEVGLWTPGADGWARCILRNVLRTFLVLLTASVSLTVPHFALLTGLIGGMTDSLQSIVLPPLIYFLESSRMTDVTAKLASIAMNPTLSNYSAVDSREESGGGASGVAGGGGPSLLSPRGFASLLSPRAPWGPHMTWRRRFERWVCVALASFGVVWIVFATTNNVKAIMRFLHPQ